MKTKKPDLAERVRVLVDATGLSQQGVRNILAAGAEPRNLRLRALWRNAMRGLR